MSKLISIILVAVLLIAFIAVWNTIPTSTEHEAPLETTTSDTENPDLLSSDFTADESTEETEEIPGTETGLPTQKLVMFFGGDVNLDSTYTDLNEYLETGRNINACFSSRLLGYLANSDVFMVNSAFAFTESRDFISKRYTYRTSPLNVDFYEKLGVNVVALANDHVYDCGEAGLLDTLKTLDTHSILSVGAGMNLAEASTPLYMDVDGMRIAFVSAMRSDGATSASAPEATETGAGVMKMYALEPFLRAISTAKENADYVVVYTHWGTEDSIILEPDQKEVAHAIVDAGADIVIGSHTHTVQEVEYYHGKPIFYSIGDLRGTKNSEAGIVRVIINTDGELWISFIPCETIDGYTDVASPDTARAIIERLNLSDTVSISPDGTVSKK